MQGSITLGSGGNTSSLASGNNYRLAGYANVPTTTLGNPNTGSNIFGSAGPSIDVGVDQAQNSALTNQTQALLRSIASMQNQLANRPLAPSLDISGIRSAASQAAQQNVNPLYQQKLNNYLQNAAAEKAAIQGKTTADISNLQAQLANSLAGTGLQRQATQQNTQAALADIAAQQQNYLRSQGTSFANQRQGILGGQGALAGSGLGQQQDVLAQEAQRNTEAAQQQQYRYSAQQKQLFENQTFAQLANSEELARLKETEGENTANFNLNDYLRQAAYGEQTFRQQNELDRQAALLQQTAQGTASRVADFISSFKNNPAIYNAAIQAYGALANS